MGSVKIHQQRQEMAESSSFLLKEKRVKKTSNTKSTGDIGKKKGKSVDAPLTDRSSRHHKVPSFTPILSSRSPRNII